MDQGDWASLGQVGGDVTLKTDGNLVLRYLTADSTSWTGRLGPGVYVLEGRSSGSASLEFLQGAAYFAQWTVMQVSNPLISSQPSDQNVNSGTTVTFSIGTSGPAGNYTYLWRKNLAPLTNNSHVSGVNTGTLIINTASFPDSGYYDVLVTETGSGVEEPSRLAHLGIVTTTAIPLQDLPELTLMAPSPNPFRLATSVPYAASNPILLRAAVYNVAGAIVRILVDDVVSGSGTLTWDGTTQSGVRSPRGIYFLHIEVGGQRQTSKLVLTD